jgi:glutamine cyclotransferase
MKLIKLFSVLFLLVLASSCEDAPSSKSRRIKRKKAPVVKDLSYSVDDKIPHSTTSFTEGFLFHNGLLYESTGSPEDKPELLSVYGTVSTSGEIEVYNQLDKKYFGEGICIFNNKVYQLTYKSREGFIYDLNTKEKLQTFTIPTKEGWGLTTDGEFLIMSDGTPDLHFLDPNTLEKTGTLKVLFDGRPVNYINELEYVNGFIYANVFTTDWIIKIDASSGKVVGKLDITDIKLQEDRLSLDALESNGIAYNPENKKFYVTGKLWQNIYVISIFE